MRKVINSLAVFTEGNPEHRPIIFVHGFPYDHTMWDSQINLFRKSNYCVAYDVRGLGESYVGDGQYTMEAYVDDLLSIIFELKIEKPILCGLSMGGYICLRAVEKHESLFSGLILCDTKSAADDDAGKLVRAEKIDMINVDGVEKFAEEFVPVCFAENAATENREIFNKTLNTAKRSNPIGVKGALLAMLGRTDTTNYLSEIEIPVSIIVGETDKLTPPDTMKSMAEKIKNCEFTVVPDSGHMAPLENPDYVNSVIEKFAEKILQ